MNTDTHTHAHSSALQSYISLTADVIFLYWRVGKEKTHVNVLESFIQYTTDIEILTRYGSMSKLMTVNMHCLSFTPTARMFKTLTTSHPFYPHTLPKIMMH